MAALVTGDRAGRLAAFIDGAAGDRFRWADRNCGLWVGDWIARETGEDVAADWRGACDTGAAVAERLAGEGGLAATAERRLAGLETCEAAAAATGDVGLVTVMTPEGPGPVLGLCQGEGFWAVLTARGVMSARLTATRVWRLPCRRP